jgi:hypothetical protein
LLFAKYDRQPLLDSYEWSEKEAMSFSFGENLACILRSLRDYFVRWLEDDTAADLCVSSMSLRTNVKFPLLESADWDVKVVDLIGRRGGDAERE